MPNPKPAILIATALGVAVGIAASTKPWTALVEQREEAKAVRADLKGVRSERARLEREEAKGRTEVGRETRAREAGFRAKGEKDLTPPPVAKKPTVDETPAVDPLAVDPANESLREPSGGTR